MPPSIANVTTAEDDEDDGGAERPADLEARVAADLRGDGALAGAELDERVEQHALDADEDRRRRRRARSCRACRCRRRSATRRTAASGSRPTLRWPARGPPRRSAAKAMAKTRRRVREWAVSQGGRHSIHAAVICCAPPRAGGSCRHRNIGRRASRGTRPRLRRSRADVDELLLDARLELELLVQARVQPGVELALGAGVGPRRAAREPVEMRVDARPRTRRRAATSLTRPQRSAVGRRHPLAEHRHLRRAPAARARGRRGRCAPPSGASPMRAKASDRYADSAATTKSHDSASEQPIPDRRAVDRRDDGLGHRAQPGQDRVVDGRRAACRRRCARRRSSAARAHVAQVAAGGERSSRACDADGAHVVVARRPLARRRAARRRAPRSRRSAPRAG